MTSSSARPDSLAALRFSAVRWLLLSGTAEGLAARALAVVIGYQLYRVTHSPLALGWLGLVEAIPALGLALLGGHFADRRDRKRIVLMTRAVMLLTALGMALFSTTEVVSLAALYALVFVSGLARGFGEPAASAFEMQVVPSAVYVNAASWLGSAGLAASMLGPAVGGFAFDLLSAHGAYLLIAALQGVALIAVWRVPVTGTPPKTEAENAEPIWDSIREGLNFVRRDPVLLGSMALDLFAVLFGGAVALLPIFADDILKVGAKGLGFLVAAPSVGALLVTLWATRFPPTRNAGRTLLLCVAGFGVSIIVFALSRSLWLSMVALVFSGGFDGISMVIRRSILRLRTPAHLRGRVASVSLLFIGSSNEIGAFESGFAANLLGTVRSVWLGGIVTLLVVGVSAWRLPELRRLSLAGIADEDSQPQSGEVLESR
ncbi:MFS transporter [Deinococcus ruber]|uniref:MFS transporter n=1 Tax=Deinococcus ruber TaxID=1848197 RepID=A0A918CHR6_9DEIO|nr:MFS transporter [Deinococcus ruber]GGR24430.1 MFS transporter [Deinococcus ruber]